MLYDTFIIVLASSLVSLSSCEDFSPTASTPSSTSSAILAVSTDGSCGDGTSFTCLNSRFGDCCSSKGWCGKDAAYCGAGCLPSFGNCMAVQDSASGRSSTKSVSTDGSCGDSVGSVCLGSTFGDCCSEKGYCGGNSSYCATGCQSEFGHCGSNYSSVQISTDGSCGNPSDTTCLGSTFGDCCSAKGYCGSSSSHCDAGCQSAFGKCPPAPASTDSLASETAATASTASPAAQPPIPTVQTTGFKVGITIASSLTFLATLSLALFLLRRRNRWNRRDPSDDHVDKADINEPPTSSEVSIPAEMSRRTSPPELSTVSYHHELPANEERTLKTRLKERVITVYDDSYRHR